MTATPATKQTKRGRGRPRKYLTAEQIKGFADLLEVGTPIMAAAANLPVSYDTVRRWRTHGEAVAADRERAALAGEAAPTRNAYDDYCTDFAHSIKEAEGRCVAHYMRLIAAAAAGGRVRTRTRRKFRAVTDPETGTTRHMLVEEERWEDTEAADWKAAAWSLERRLPEWFARMERREVSGPGGGPIEEVTVNVGDAVLNDDEVRAAADRILEAYAVDPSTPARQEGE